MNEQLRAKAGLVYNVVETVILAMSVGLMTWMCTIVIAHGNMLASYGTQIQVNSDRIGRIETSGSAGLMTHVKEDDARVGMMDRRIEKLEQAVIILQSAPAELKAIAIEIRNLREGQLRIENAIESHMKQTGKP